MVTRSQNDSTGSKNVRTSTGSLALQILIASMEDNTACASSIRWVRRLWDSTDPLVQRTLTASTFAQYVWEQCTDPFWMLFLLQSNRDWTTPYQQGSDMYLSNIHLAADIIDLLLEPHKVMTQDLTYTPLWMPHPLGSILHDSNLHDHDATLAWRVLIALYPYRNVRQYESAAVTGIQRTLQGLPSVLDHLLYHSALDDLDPEISRPQIAAAIRKAYPEVPGLARIARIQGRLEG